VTVHRGELQGRGRRFCLVASRFNRLVVERLVDGARSVLEEAGVEEDALDLVWVPGAWELPWAAARAVDGGYDAVVALGCVIRGETPHFDYICEAATRGLGELTVKSEVPVTLGLLTCDTADQARERAGGSHGNKGAEAAEAALELADLAARLS
jgi:6,7-dimethyl-8-ribityllumazine synthase